MYEHKKKQGLLTDYLEEMYSQGYRLAYYDKELKISVWDREIKKKRTETIDIPTTEFIEFITAYRKINNNGSYADTLVKKYRKVLKEIPHKDMMAKLEEYETHLKAYSKPPLQVGTFLNQKRYLDTYETVKVDFVNKRRDDILKEKKIEGFVAESIIQEADGRDYKNKDKEMTSNIFNNIIKKYTG